MEQTERSLRTLSDYLAARHDAILEASLAAENRDPEQTTVHALTRAQFSDHIPQILAAFERRLRAPSGGLRAETAEADQQTEEIKHGLHRWQQGYRLRELIHEWGHLHRSVFDEIIRFSETHPEIPGKVIIEAQSQLLSLVSDAISESTGQYARLQQEEAAGHVRDLQKALSQFQDMDRRRAALIHQAVHDLRGNVQSVSSAAEVLRESGIPESERILFVNLLQQGADAVGSMLGDLMDLARLEAGQEKRELSTFDGAAMLAEFCRVSEPIARARTLYLRCDGPAALSVQGDAGKIRRIVQNLVHNALKYTDHGGVTLSWGEEGVAGWWIKIVDTGPGLMRGPGAPIIQDMVQATDSAREADKQSLEHYEISQVLPPAASQSVPSSIAPRQQPGEGIGLSIVKRLCDLLDARIELASSNESGTTFRIIFPRKY